MPPGTPQKGNTLIFDVLAISTVEGDLRERKVCRAGLHKQPRGHHPDKERESFRDLRLGSGEICIHQQEPQLIGGLLILKQCEQVLVQARHDAHRLQLAGRRRSLDIAYLTALNGRKVTAWILIRYEKVSI